MHFAFVTDMSMLRPRTLMRDALLGFGLGLVLAVGVGLIASASQAGQVAASEPR